MSAVLRDERLLLPMTVKQLDAVLAIELQAYPFPWTRGNFIDSLAAGYPAQVLHGSHGELLGYFIAMEGVDELHLLNITVAPAAQGQGHARFMLDELCTLGRSRGAHQIWLEVRGSNLRARSIYERYGFRHIGLRRGYYPASREEYPNGREDAIVMSLSLEAARGVD
ncbi:ribosomal protein S18-alanine N-acetyltransferase [Piscinibacter gummiphilus]|uniref:[Ribosomal protein bS18]-alanine N-acetyltransferase n=1 Tax=Piscinibacter gummiphilus TaxID=946333 RepID=A0ABZ0CS63_9BURK|nr:ribosomal protein S18-alanine N-acetyltransferase [Piscinibacter gummiphilus]WOB07831.1 ribosomal protein S18-alanine N-acetyltransferase [Piscinibacter gummiphilus]